MKADGGVGEVREDTMSLQQRQDLVGRGVDLESCLARRELRFGISQPADPRSGLTRDSGFLRDSL